MPGLTLLTRLIALPAELIQGSRLNPCNQNLARPIRSVWCLPCNTGNPNQNYQVHIIKLHKNYRLD